MKRPRKHPAQSEEYKVGFGRPPRENRFQPGVSGNPTGRKKGRESAHEQLDRIMSRKMTVTENGVAKRLSRQEVMLATMAGKALKGDLKAMGFILNLLLTHANDPAATIDPGKLCDADQALLDSFLTDASDPDDMSALITEDGKGPPRSSGADETMGET